MRLIDAEAFEKQIEKEIIRNNTIAHAHFCNTGEKDHIRSTVGGVFVIVKDWVNRQPTIEAKPVVHAHWTEGAPFHQCSNCNGFALSFDNEPYRKEILSNYCPHCGAQMDEVASDNNVGSKTKGVKIPVISMEDVAKLAKEMEK